MPNEQIISTIVKIIFFLLACFARLIFNKIIEPYIPERKKLISYIRKFLFFSVAYVLPITGIIRLMIVTTVVDKYFVLSMALWFFALAVNFGIYLQELTFNSIDRLVVKIQNIFTNLLDTTRQSFNLTRDTTHDIVDNLGNHSDALAGIMDLMRGLNDLQNILHERLKALEDERKRK